MTRIPAVLFGLTLVSSAIPAAADSRILTRIVRRTDGLSTNTLDASADLVDGRTAIDGILKSPILTPYPFAIGGQDVGPTQCAGAYMRANFWSQLTPARNSHVLLAPGATSDVLASAIPFSTADFTYHLPAATFIDYSRAFTSDDQEDRHV